MIDKGNRTFEVIDGQQRLTTLVLLFVAMKCFLIKAQSKNIQSEWARIEKYLPNTIETIDDIIYNKERFKLTTQKKVKIEKNADFDYDVILSEVMECKEYPSLDMHNIKPEQREIINRYFKNRTYFEQQIEHKFTTQNTFAEKDFIALQNFADFIQNKVSLIRIEAPDFNIAYRIFEVLNNRGLQLSDKDLFRNFIISQFAYLQENKKNKYSSLDPSRKWIDLERNRPLTIDFLRRLVESKNGMQVKTTPYNELVRIYEKQYKDTPTLAAIEAFYNDIQEELRLYTLIVNEQIQSIDIQNRILFLVNAGNAHYTKNLLLALFRQFNYNGEEHTKIKRFLQTYETFVMYILLAPGKRFSKSPVNEAIQYLNTQNYDKAVACFEMQSAQLEKLKIYINDKIEDNATAKLLIAKYIWILQSKSTDIVSQYLNYEKATLEHIIPQNPASGSNWLNDFSAEFRNEYTYKLGNMTLLTKPMNSSAKHFDFNIKTKTYQKTLVPVSRDIANLKTISENDVVSRHEKIVNTIIEDIMP